MSQYKYIRKNEAMFLMNFYSKVLDKEIPVSFQLVDKRTSIRGHIISLNPFMRQSLSIDRYFEKECKNIKTMVGLKKKANIEFNNSGRTSFNISQDLITKIDDFVVVPVRNTEFWKNNIDKYLEFVNFACEETKKTNYQKNYLQLIWTLTTESYFDFISKVPGLEKEIEKILFKNNLLSNPFLSPSRKTGNDDVDIFLNINFDVLVVKNLERFFELDEQKNPIFENQDWSNYYIGGLLSLICNKDINILKFYENNPAFKSSLDFLVQEYPEKLPASDLIYLKNNQIGVKKEFPDDIFLDKNETISIGLSLNDLMKIVPMTLYQRADFSNTLGQVISSVINNTNNNTEANYYLSKKELLISIKTSEENNTEYFKSIIKKCIKEINVLNVESHNSAIVDRLSIMVNEMIMLDSTKENSISNYKLRKV